MAKKPETPWEDEEQAAVVADAPGWEEDSADLRADMGVPNVLNWLGRGTDYAGGAVRTLPAWATGLVDKKEALEALAFQKDFPSMRETLKRAGVPAGPSTSDMLPIYTEEGDGWYLEKGGPADFTMRDAAGTVGDALTDPGTWAPALKATKLGKWLRPTTEVGEQIGKKTFQSGLVPVDQISEKYAKKPVSEQLWDKGIWGRMTSIADQSEKEMGKLLAERNEILQAGDAAGVLIDPAKNNANTVAHLRAGFREPVNEGDARELLTLARKYDKRGPVGPTRFTDSKTALTERAGNDSYAIGGRPSYKTEGYQAMARDAREGVERSIEKAMPGEGKRLADVHDDLGGLLTVQKIMGREADKAERKNFFTSVDGMIGGLGYNASNKAFAPEVLVAKKLADAAKTTAVRTGAGMALKNLNQSTLTYPALKRLLIDANRSEMPAETEVPWED